MYAETLKPCIHAALVQTAEEMQDPDNWNSRGICSNMRERIQPERFAKAAEDFLSMEMKDWPHHSGDFHYPLPSTVQRYGRYWPDFGGLADFTPTAAYIFSSPEDKWDRVASPYAALRWELLEWLIARFES